MSRFQKSAGGKDGTPGRPTTSPSRRRKALIWIERILLVSGLTLVGFYGAARMESGLKSRAALKHFAADKALAQPGTESDLDNPARIWTGVLPSNSKCRVSTSGFGANSGSRPTDRTLANIPELHWRCSGFRRFLSRPRFLTAPMI